MRKFISKLIYIPWLVMLIFNIIIFVFIITLAFGENNISLGVRVAFLLATILLASLISYLRIKLFGKSTIKIKQNSLGEYGLLALVSFNTAVILNVLLIKYLRIDFFINGFNQDQGISPLKWLDYTNDNFNRLVLYCAAVIFINYLLVGLFFLIKAQLKKHGIMILEKNNDPDKGVSSFLALFEGAIIFLLFIPEKMNQLWQLVLDSSVANYILGYLFGSSILAFNLYFLLRKHNK